MVIVAAVMLFYNIVIRKCTADTLLVNRVEQAEKIEATEDPDDGDSN